MEEKDLTSVSQQEEVNDSIDYIEAIKEIKQNSVDREAYNKLREENKRLLNSLVNGESVDVKKEEPVNIDELRDKLFNKESTNLEYISNALKLREELMKQGKPDPFLPAGKNIIPTEEDIKTADRVAKVLQECVDYADGDSNVFTNELQRVTVDSVLPKTRR